MAVHQKRLHVKQRLAIQARLGVLRTSATRGATVGLSLAARLGKRRVVKRLQPARGACAAGRAWAAVGVEQPGLCLSRDFVYCFESGLFVRRGRNCRSH